MPLATRTVYIVVDVVRATTTLTTQMEYGAERVYVAPSVAEARLARQTLGPSALLAGEAGGIAPPGFDLGNSPAEFTRVDLAGRDIIFATTNGTRALLACAGGAAVFAGALRNASAAAARAVAAAAHLERADAPDEEHVRYTASGATPDVSGEAFVSPKHRVAAAIVIVCSGRGGLPAYDDTVCAGVLAARVQASAQRLRRTVSLGDGARIALATAAEAQRGGIPAALTASDAGRAVVEVGLAGDLEWCAAIDTTDVVPQVAEIRPNGLLVVRRSAAPAS
jgi:2-phosphosulfolactate phosphatase